MLVRRIARPLLSAIFIAEGIDALRNPGQRAAKASPLIDKSVETLPNSVTENIPVAVAQKLPADPETLVKINAAVQIGGGALLATARRHVSRRWSSRGAWYRPRLPVTTSGTKPIRHCERCSGPTSSRTSACSAD
jgi:hypothetical protein